MTERRTPISGAQTASSPEGDFSGRRLGREVLIYGLGIAAGRLASLIMLPIYTRLLTPRDYGVLQLLDIVLDVAAIMVSAGVTAGVMRFYFKTRDDAERDQVLSSALVLQLGLNLVGSLLLALSAGVIWRRFFGGVGPATLVYIAAANFTLLSLSDVPLLRMQAERKATLYAGTTLGRLLLQLGLNILFLVGFRWGVLGVLLSTLITSSIFGALTLIWLYRRTVFAISRRALRDLRRFGLPYQVTTAATFVLTFGDRFFIQHFRGLAAVGIYGLGYQFGFLLSAATVSPFMRAWIPQRYTLVDEAREFRDAKYNQGFRYLNVLLLSAAVGIIVFVRPVLQIMSDSSFWPAARIVPIIVAAYVIQSWGLAVRFGIDVSEQTRYVTYANWASVGAIVVLYSLLIPRFGAMGAAVATLMAFFIRFVMLYRFSQRLWPVSYEWSVVLKLVVMAGLLVATSLAVDAHRIVWEIALGATLVSVYLGLASVVALDYHERQFFLRTLLKVPREAFARFTR